MRLFLSTNNMLSQEIMFTKRLYLTVMHRVTGCICIPFCPPGESDLLVVTERILPSLDKTFDLFGTANL